MVDTSPNRAIRSERLGPSTNERPRVELLEQPAAQTAASAAGVSPIAADLNVFRTWLQHPDLAGWLHELIMGLLWRGRLDARLRELVIMRLGWTTNSVYEWTQHWNIATEFLQFEPDDLLAVRDWHRAERFGPAERAVLAATDDVVRDGEISDDAWAACAGALGDDPALLVELSAVIAVWHMVSTMLRSLRVPLEDGVVPWPPDGLHPRNQGR